MTIANREKASVSRFPYISSTPIWETYAKSGWVSEKTNDFIKKLAEDHPMEVDYSAIKLGYLNLGA